MNLTINNSSTSSEVIETCGGYMWNGQVYFDSGIYTYNTTTVQGCDSIATLNLTVNNSSVSFTTITSCDSYVWNGATYTESGSYVFNTININGCDSTA